MSKSKNFCLGCRNDYYNHIEKNGCWSFEKATVVERTAVRTWQDPPYKWSPKSVLSCYSKVGQSLIKEDDPRIG